DRVALGVAVDDCRVRPDGRFEPGDPIAVDEDVVVRPEPGYRATHREMGGVVDVQAVDLGHGCGTDAHGDGALPDEGRQALPLEHRQRLRIADPGDAAR